MWCFNLRFNLMYVTWWRSLRDVRWVGKSLYSSTKENKTETSVYKRLERKPRQRRIKAVRKDKKTNKQVVQNSHKGIL